MIFVLTLTLTFNFYGYINTPAISKKVYDNLNECQEEADNFLYGPSVDLSKLPGIESITSTAKCEVLR